MIYKKKPLGPFTVDLNDSECTTVKRGREVFSQRSPRVSMRRSTISRRRRSAEVSRSLGGVLSAWMDSVAELEGSRWGAAGSVILADCSPAPYLPSIILESLASFAPLNKHRLYDPDGGSFEPLLSLLLYSSFLPSIIPSPSFTYFPRVAIIPFNHPSCSLLTDSRSVPACCPPLSLFPPVLTHRVLSSTSESSEHEDKSTDASGDAAPQSCPEVQSEAPKEDGLSTPIAAPQPEDNDELGPLPDNWEMAYTEKGEVYFIE